MTSALSSLTSSVLTSTAFSPIGLAVGPTGRQSNPVLQVSSFRRRYSITRNLVLVMMLHLWGPKRTDVTLSCCSFPCGLWEFESSVFKFNSRRF
jgi:hypothetical protein